LPMAKLEQRRYKECRNYLMALWRKRGFLPVNMLRYLT